MPGKFLIRFDDICPTMNWTVWNTIESFLCALDISPILAVVPDSRDVALEVDPPNNQFWRKVRNWKERGWSIAVHGHQHCYVNSEAGILGINQRSEFAGLSYDMQRTKLEQSLAIFRKHSVEPKLWVAPAHSFDETTIVVLRELGINIISDGFFPYPGCGSDHMFWIPQQLWRFYNLPFGVWTVCCHHNKWIEADLQRFRSQLDCYRDRIVTVEHVLEQYFDRRLCWSDKAFAAIWLTTLRTKRFAKALWRPDPG